MTTTKSFSKKSSRVPAVFKSTLRSQLPFLIVLAILLLCITTIAFFTSEISARRYLSELDLMNLTEYYKAFFDSGIYVEPGQSYIVTFVMGVLSFVLAIFTNSYMLSKKTTDLYHALPVRRSGLLTANFLASMTTLLLPYIVVSGGTMLAQLAIYGRYGCFGPSYFAYMGVDLLCVLVYAAAIWLFTSFVAVNVGTIFDTFAISAVIGLSPPVLYLVVGSIWESFTYGANFSILVATRLSPFLFAFDRINHSQPQYGRYVSYTYDHGKTLLVLLVWALIAAVFGALALLCYGRRKSEIAEQTQPAGVFQIVVKCIAAFLGATLFYLMTWTSDAFMIVQVIAMLFGALLAGVIAELILSRGIKTIVRNLKWMALGGVVFILFVFMIPVDIIGYETKVPQADEVASVYISYGGRFEDQVESWRYYSSWSDETMPMQTLTDPQSIATVVNMHSLAVANYPKERISGYDWTDDDHYSQFRSRYLTINYQLKNGKELRRVYHTVNTDALLSLTALEDQEDFIRSNHPVFLRDSENAEIPQEKTISSIHVAHPANTKDFSWYTPNETQLRDLLDAIQQDLLEDTTDAFLNPNNSVYCYLNINYYYYSELAERLRINYRNRYYDYLPENGSIVVRTDHTRTIRALEQIGATFPADAQEVDSFYVVSVSDILWGFDDFRIHTVKNDSWSAGDWFGEKLRYYQEGSTTDWSRMYGPVLPDKLPEITDEALMQAVSDRAVSQIMLTPDNAWRDTAALVSMKDGQPVGYRFIRVSDLPASVQTEVRSYLEELGANFDNPIGSVYSDEYFNDGYYYY